MVIKGSNLYTAEARFYLKSTQQGSSGCRVHQSFFENQQVLPGPASCIPQWGVRHGSFCLTCFYSIENKRTRATIFHQHGVTPRNAKLFQSCLRQYLNPVCWSCHLGGITGGGFLFKFQVWKIILSWFWSQREIFTGKIWNLRNSCSMVNRQEVWLKGKRR